MISQGRISDSIAGFPFLQQWGIGDYKDRTAPALFVGCYTPTDFNIIMRHQGLAVLLWGGTDACRREAPPRMACMVGRKNIKHIAQSGFIAKDLKRAGLLFTKIPLTTVPKVKDPMPLGDSVYCYAPQTRYRVYGGHILEKVIKKLPEYNFIITVPKQYSKEELFKLYAKSFIGLRLTRHDGLPHTVVELGLRGRACVFNDNVPGAIRWKDVDDIVNAIKAAPAKPQTVADKMYDYINTPTDWLEEKYWICT